MDDELKDAAKNYKGKNQPDFDKLSSDEKVNMLLEANSKLQQRVWDLERELDEIKLALKENVVSSQVIECNKWHEAQPALILVYRDGRTQALCDGACHDCKYQRGWPS